MALGVSARTAKAWRLIEGAPIADGSGRYHIGEWLNWAAKHGKKVPTGCASSKQDWEIERIKKQVEGLELDLRERRGELVRIEDVKKWGAEAVHAFKTEILSIPTKLAPQVVGLPIAEAELRISQAVCDALTRLNRAPWASPE